jgi:deoxyribodipyrimidine photolyase
MFYAFIKKGKINGTGQCRTLNADITDVEISEEVYNDIKRYMWNGEAVVVNPDYKEDNSERIAELKQLLSDTDYVVIKIAEGSATKEEYADVIEQRKAWRNEIRELEK